MRLTFKVVGWVKIFFCTLGGPHPITQHEENKRLTLLQITERERKRERALTNIPTKHGDFITKISLCLVRKSLGGMLRQKHLEDSFSWPFIPPTTFFKHSVDYLKRKMTIEMLALSKRHAQESALVLRSKLHMWIPILLKIWAQNNKLQISWHINSEIFEIMIIIVIKCFRIIVNSFTRSL